jgi:SAM-dependent methyltransferase
MALEKVIPDPPGYDAPGYKPRSHSRHLTYASLIADLERNLPTLEGRVIDVGCGVQPYRRFLGPKVTEHVGVDRLGAFAQPDLEGDALNLPVPDASFDAALSTQVLEHVPQPQLALKELARVLRPGGTLILTCPGTWPHHEQPYDFYRYTRFGLEYLLQDAGFQIIELKAQGGTWATIGQMICLEVTRWPLRSIWIPLINSLAAFLDKRPARQELALNWFVRAVRK